MVAICRRCHRRQQFAGTAEEILRALDDAGWRELSLRRDTFTGVCRECAKQA